MLLGVRNVPKKMSNKNCLAVPGPITNFNSVTHSYNFNAMQNYCYDYSFRT